MKIAFLGVLGLVMSTSAFASIEKYVCDKPYGEGNKGVFVLKLKLAFPAGTDGSSAKLYVKGERAARKLACAVPAIEPRPRGGDMFSPLAFCNEATSDTGYSVSIRSGGQAALTIAHIVAKNYLGDKPVAELVCRSLSH